MYNLSLLTLVNNIFSGMLNQTTLDRVARRIVVRYRQAEPAIRFSRWVKAI